MGVPLLLRMFTILLLISFKSIAAEPSGGAMQELYPQWLASPSIADCAGPQDVNGEPWYAMEFDASTWENVQPPMINDVGLSQDRFYRTVYIPSANASRFYLSLASDDGARVYINEQLLGQYGGGCHQPGCVGRIPWLCSEKVPWRDIEITEYIKVDQPNIIAVHVSNQQYHDPGRWSYFSVRIDTTQLLLPLIKR